MTDVWSHVEFGHTFRVEEIKPRRGRKFRLYDNGQPALGGQWHYTLHNAIAQARCILQGSYSRRIAFLEQRVQNLEWELHHDH